MIINARNNWEDHFSHVGLSSLGFMAAAAVSGCDIIIAGLVGLVHTTAMMIFSIITNFIATKMNWNLKKFQRIVDFVAKATAAIALAIIRVITSEAAVGLILMGSLIQFSINKFNRPPTPIFLVSTTENKVYTL